MKAPSTPPGAATILVVDDNELTRAAFVIALERSGYRVAEAGDGTEALELAAREKPALVVLDLDMPRLDGMETLRQLRAAGDGVPVLILTALDDVERRVQGLQDGADDFLGKPCDAREFLARVAALLRRSRPAAAKVSRLRFGEVVVELADKMALRAGQPLALTRKELAILEVLARRPGRAVAREAILREVWGYAETVQTRTLDTHVWRLRRKIGDDGEEPRWIRNVPGIGYALDAEAVAAGRTA
jgi:DNA-binding response OmpR family regulator